MKRIRYLYEKLIDVDYLKESIHRAFKKKKKTKSIKRILSNPDKHARNISIMLQKGLLPFVRERRIKVIRDGKQKKCRVISKATNYEHVVHHAVIGLLEDRFMKSFYRYSIASIPKRGDLYGKRHLERWIRSYKGRKLYILKFDIHKFFDSIDRKIMLKRLSTIIKDNEFLKVIERIIFYDKSETNRGIPIGGYKFYPWKTTIRKTTLKSARRATLRFSKKPNVRNARSVLSYFGRLSYADVHGYFEKYIKPIAKKSASTRTISSYDRRIAA